MIAPATRPQPGSLRRTGGRWPAGLAWSLVGVFASAGSIAAWLQWRTYLVHAPPGVGWWAWAGEWLIMGAVFAAFAVVGAVIISRRPDQRLGWLMLVSAASVGVGSLGNASVLASARVLAADPATAVVVVTLASEALADLGGAAGLIVVPLLYPDGRLPSPRWRPVGWLVAGVVALLAAGNLLSERVTATAYPLGAEPVRVFDVTNPLRVGWLRPLDAAITAVGFPIMLGLLTLVAVAVVVRFRRSRGVERLQMKWFAFTAGVVLLVVPLFGVGQVVMDEPPAGVPPIVSMLPFLLFAGYPVAVGVAVLRYRLYEIDRIISRTVSYGLVIVVLGAVYVTVVVGLGAGVAALTGGEGGDLTVAASVLAVVVLFRPVRTRVQTAVERRFNRSGYDARAAVDGFADGLRDDVGLEPIRDAVVETTAVALSPERVSVWLTPETRQR